MFWTSHREGKKEGYFPYWRWVNAGSKAGFRRRAKVTARGTVATTSAMAWKTVHSTTSRPTRLKVKCIKKWAHGGV